VKLNETKTIYLFLIALIFLFDCFSYAEAVDKPGTAYTLDRLLQTIAQHNLDMRITKLDTKIATEDYRDTRALANPEFEYSKGRGKSSEGLESAELWGMALRWSIPNPIYRYYYLKSVRTNLTEAQIKEEIGKREIVKEIKTRFYKLLLYNRLKTFAEEKLRIVGEVEKITEAKVEIGESKEIDALRASAEMRKSNTALFRIEKVIAYEKNKLNELFNYALPEDFTVTGEFDVTPRNEMETKIQQLVDASPRIRLEINRVNKESANLKATRFSIIDSVELFGEREKELDGKVWKVGIGFSIPLFNLKSAAVRRAEFLKEKAETELEHAKKHFFSDIHQMISEIRILEKEVEAFKSDVLKEGIANLELYGKLYKEGEIPLVVFMDSQNSSFETQQRYYEAITEWNMLNAELESLL
jgi:outer membrane protein TolC